MNRRWTLAAAAVALSAAAFLGARDARSSPAGATPAEATWSGDTVHSFVMFRIKHLGTSWAYGRFDDFTVSLMSSDAGLSSVAFTVKADSVDTGNPKRDQHLKSPDFLNAKQFGEITFRSTKVVPGGDGAEVTGDLTLHGVTKPLTVKVSKVGAGKGMKGEELAGWETSFEIKRSDFGMTNMVGPAGVGDEVLVTVAVEAAKQ